MCKPMNDLRQPRGAFVAVVELGEVSHHERYYAAKHAKGDEKGLIESTPAALSMIRLAPPNPPGQGRKPRLRLKLGPVHTARGRSHGLPRELFPLLPASRPMGPQMSAVLCWAPITSPFHVRHVSAALLIVQSPTHNFFLRCNDRYAVALHTASRLVI
jgi:hypothetical protein